MDTEQIAKLENLSAPKTKEQILAQFRPKKPAKSKVKSKRK